jgi:hypothetical protein
MSASSRDVDAPTLLGAGIVVYVLSTLAHEMGHLVAMLLVGVKPTTLGTVYVNGDPGHVSAWGARAVCAAGTVVTFVLAAFGALAFRSTRSRGMARYVLWLIATENGSVAAGYFMFSPLTGAGDWANFNKGLEPQLPIAIGMTVFGTFLFVTVLTISARALTGLVGAGAERTPKLVRMTVVPYLAGCSAVTGATALTSANRGFFLMAAIGSSFFATSTLLHHLWLEQKLYKKRNTTNDGGVSIDRSIVWIAAGALILGTYAMVLGPGLRLG